MSLDYQVKADFPDLHKDTDAFKGALNGRAAAAFTVAVNFTKFAFEALAVASAAAIAAYRQQEKAEQRFRATLYATGRQSQITADAGIAYAKQLQAQTTFTDNAILEVESMLVRVRGMTEGKLKTATALALDIAAATGQDVKSVALVLARSLTDPKSGLAGLYRLGVTIPKKLQDLTESLIDAGDLAGAQDALLLQLQGNFGGVAQQMAGGTGSVDQLWNVMVSVAEEFGRLIAPEVVSLSKKATEFVNRLAEFQDQFVFVKAIVIGAVSGIVAAVEVLLQPLAELAKLAGTISISPSLVTAAQVRSAVIEIFKPPILRLTEASAAFITSYNKSTERTFDRYIEFKEKAAVRDQQERAKIAKLRGAQTDEAVETKQSAFDKKIEAEIKRNADLRSVLDAKNADKKKLVMLEMQNRINELDIQTQDFRLETELRLQESRKFVIAEHYAKLEELRADLHEAIGEAVISDSEIRAKLILKNRFQIMEKEAALRKERLSDREEYWSKQFDQSNESTKNILTITKAINTFNRDTEKLTMEQKLMIADAAFGALSSLIDAMGEGNFLSSKAARIALHEIRGLIAKALIMSKSGDWISLILHIILCVALRAMQIYRYLQMDRSTYRAPNTQFAEGTGGNPKSIPLEYFTALVKKDEIIIPRTAADMIRDGLASLAGPSAQYADFDIDVEIPADLADNVEIEVQEMEVAA